MSKSLNQFKSFGKTKQPLEIFTATETSEGSPSMFLHYPAKAINFESRKLSAFRITAKVFFLILLLSKIDAANCGGTTVNETMLQENLVTNSSTKFSACTVTFTQTIGTVCNLKAVCTCNKSTNKFTKEQTFNNADETARFSDLDGNEECTECGSTNTIVNVATLKSNLEGDKRFSSCAVTFAQPLSTTNCVVKAICTCSGSTNKFTYDHTYSDGVATSNFKTFAPAGECTYEDCWEEDGNTTLVDKKALANSLQDDGDTNYTSCNVTYDKITTPQINCSVTAKCKCSDLKELTYAEGFTKGTTIKAFLDNIPAETTCGAMPTKCWKYNVETTIQQMTSNGFTKCEVNSEIVSGECKVTATCNCPRLYEPLKYTETFLETTTATTFKNPPTKCTMTTALIAIIIVSSLAGVIIMVGLGYYFIKKYRQN